MDYSPRLHLQQSPSNNASSDHDARVYPSPGNSNHAIGSSSAHVDTPYLVPEEDAHVQTLYGMVDRQSPTCLTMPTVNSGPSKGQHLIEYYDRLNSISFLSEALGNRRRKRLIQIDLSGRGSGSTKQRELADLEPADVAYLDAKLVFEIPPKEAWYVWPVPLSLLLTNASVLLSCVYSSNTYTLTLQSSIVYSFVRTFLTTIVRISCCIPCSPMLFPMRHLNYSLQPGILIGTPPRRTSFSKRDCFTISAARNSNCTCYKDR
jgi:hypothetical protein